MKMQTKKKTALVLALLMLLTAAACGKRENRRGGRRQGPPAEAIAACKGKQAGDSVEFKGRNSETVQGTCREINGQLAAVPAGMSPGRQD